MEWRWIPGFEGRCKIRDGGDVWSVAKNRVLLPHVYNGYLRVSLWDAPTRRTVSQAVNRLVLLAFVGPCPADKEQAAHLNGDSLDNRVVNLVWATRSENMEHARGHGTLSLGERHGNAKLSEADVTEMRSRRMGGEKVADLAEEYGVSTGAVSMATRGVRWRHLAEVSVSRAVGERSPKAKLTEVKVREIRKLYAAGVGFREIGRRFGVSHGSVRDIVQGRSWTHLL